MDVESRDQNSKEKHFKHSEVEMERERHKHKEEYATELAAAPGLMRQKELNSPEDDRPHEHIKSADQVEEESPSRTIGWVSMTLAIISLFFFPVWLGVSAIVLGIIAYVRGTRALGAWSVVIGGISALSYIVLIPG
ncbi:MAG: hypothetical protein K0Q81_867 [Paenibacillus sp.]|nr:hypothetical protein [Paenibacillus sp.]